jgi:pilus assembly protein CpaC
MPVDPNDPLRHAFADNIRRIYGRKAPEALNEPGRYGYIMD